MNWNASVIHAVSAPEPRADRYGPPHSPPLLAQNGIRSEGPSPPYVPPAAARCSRRVYLALELRARAISFKLRLGFCPRLRPTASLPSAILVMFFLPSPLCALPYTVAHSVIGPCKMLPELVWHHCRYLHAWYVVLVSFLWARILILAYSSSSQRLRPPRLRLCTPKPRRTLAPHRLVRRRPCTPHPLQRVILVSRAVSSSSVSVAQSSSASSASHGVSGH
jgi:hypothetical protein